MADSILSLGPESVVIPGLTKRLLPLLTAITLMLAAGCESGWIKAAKMNKLSLGMPRADVIKILGEPHSTEAKPGEETLWYLEDQGVGVHQPYFVTWRMAGHRLWAGKQVIMQQSNHPRA